MVDSFSESSTQGYFSRIGNSIKGILFGGALYIAAFPLLFINEGCAVKRYQDLAAGRGAIVEVSAEKVDAGNEGKLVYMTGKATSSAKLQDKKFAVDIEGIRLQRVAEMYQWKEDKETKTDRQVGGSEKTTTTYSYRKEWSSSLIDSSSFNPKGQSGHENPESMPVSGETKSSDDVKLGGFKLTSALVTQINDFKPVDLTEEMVKKSKEEFKRDVNKSDGWIYLGKDSSNPQVGDVRVKFLFVPSPQTVSLFAAQVGDSFASWKTPSGRMLEQSLSMGTVTPDEMFSAKESQQAMLTWILRGVGLFMMFLGLTMIMAPLKVLADVVPFIGSIVGAGTSIIAFLIALPSALITIAIGWLFYRPLIGVPLLVVALASIIALFYTLRKNKPAKPGKSGEMPPGEGVGA